MKHSSTSRRGFIKQNSISGLGILLMGKLGVPGILENNESKIEVSDDQQKIGEWSLDQLREQYKNELFKRFLPNMDKLAIDHEYGGFMCDVDIENRKLLSTHKSAWYEGRGMWTYSFLYNNFGKDPHYLEIAKKSKDFILKNQPSDNQFWVSSYTREGQPASGPGDIYCNLFIAEGLCEYSKATGEKKYLELAKQIMLSALDRYDQPDYKYAITYGPSGAPDITGPRVLGHWMVFLRGATQFLRIDMDRDIEKIADRSVEAIMHHHLNKEYGLLNEGLNHDFSLPQNAWSQFAYLGHGCETLWMVMDEALRRKDSALFQQAAKVFKRHVSVATDALDGGFFRALDHVDEFRFKTDKVLWLQEEILTGSLILIEHEGDEWAYEQFAKTYDYIQKKFMHPEFAFVVESGNRDMNIFQKRRAEHYHHPRQLMLNLMAIERLLHRKIKSKR